MEITEERANELQERLRREYPYPRSLARALGTQEPDGDNSPGGRFLSRLLTDFDVAVVLSADYPEDAASEFADSAVTVMTYDQWAIWLDLCLWQWNSDLVSEVGWEDIGSLAAKILYEVAERAYGLFLDDVRRWIEEDAEEDEEDAEDDEDPPDFDSQLKPPGQFDPSTDDGTVAYY